MLSMNRSTIRAFSVGTVAARWGEINTLSIAKGQLRMVLSNAATYECRTWESADSLKGEEIDWYSWSEYYQFPGMQCVMELNQNLERRKGQNWLPTTPDRPHIEELVARSESEDPRYKGFACIHGIKRKENPYAFNFDKMVTELADRTKEKWLIHWEGCVGEYVGSVYDYLRGQRVFTAYSHPQLFVKPDDETALLDTDGNVRTISENLRVPINWIRVLGFDGGTHRGFIPMVFDEDGNVFFLAEFGNYRYVSGIIDKYDDRDFPSVAGEARDFCDRLKGNWHAVTDPNSQWKTDCAMVGINVNIGSYVGEKTPEVRTDRCIEYFQHDRAYFAPWLSMLPFEFERARYPDKPTSAGRLSRISENDHFLDCAEHGCAAMARKKAKANPKDIQLSWLEKIKLGHKLRPKPSHPANRGL